ncbi:hypothetical protein RHMOL_Rhmol04G0118600 [Rhododendron molle]|uniref:Uncharacterized protein n=1 Tax=Rhododendron molle TaxID=49168 RepID=A0ACC0P1S9_RHOML|nr:hypothetical protein RHMOL_Rhmol04G0118600 [Rhododendron molle]
MATGLVLLRKSPSTRLALAALTSSVDSLLHRRHNHSHFSKPSTDLAKSTNESSGNGQNGKFSTGWLSRVYGVASRRGFHGAAGLSFRASVPASNAGYAAAADFSDEDQTRGQGGSSGGASDVGLEISKLGISEHIVSALAGKGITKLFPIQKAVLEPAMKGCDMIGRARTGTGKTLAFGIPIMDKILRFNEKHGCGRNPLAMVLAPTRELAKQVDKEFAEAAPKLESLCVYGGVPISRQMSQLAHGVDVVVGTPGRVIDLIKRGALKLSEIQFLVLDEADQMLNVGFADDVETILQHVPAKRQCMMFSATMPSWIRKLTQKYLKDPLTIDLVGDSVQKLADGISLYAIASEMFEKPQIIGPLITEHAKGGKCIVFTQTKRDADRLAYSMQRSFKCEALHGDISQNQREITLSGFRDGRFNVLVATDVAARGLDVPNVDLLPRISVAGGTSNIFNDMGSNRGGPGGRFGDSGSGRYGGPSTGGFGEYGSSRSGFGGSGSGRSGGGFGGFNSSRSGNSGGYGSGRSGGFGNSGSGRSGGFGDFLPSRSSGGFGDDKYGRKSF